METGDVKKMRELEKENAKLNKLVEKHPRNGFWLLLNRLRKQGFIWNHKRVYRVINIMDEFNREFIELSLVCLYPQLKLFSLDHQHRTPEWRD
jgi:hypothetical protein